MVGTKAKWFAPVKPARADPPVRGKPIYPGLLDEDKKRKGRENRRKRQPQRKPGGAPHYKPYDYPVRERPERTPRPISPKPKVPGAGRVRLPRIPGIPGLDVIDFVDDFINPSKNVPPALPWNYRWCRGPVNFPPRVPRPFPDLGGWVSDPWFTDGGSCDLVVPLDGQATGAPQVTDYGILLGAERCYWWRNYKHSGAFTRGYNAGTIVRTTVADPQPLSHRPVVRIGHWGSPADPNIHRWLPSQPDPFPAYVPGFAEGLPSPEALANPDLPYQPDYAWQFEPIFGLNPGLAPGLDQPPGTPWTNAPTAPPTPRPPIKPVTRDPPPKGEKQRKVLTKSARVGIALYRALDAASEGSEIVDALYEALPDDVRKRWKCPDSRMGDSFGQYGFGNADCKARAIYHNLHRMNVEQGLKNIIKNQLEDAIIGGMQSVLPRNTGAAHSHGEKEFSKQLDKFLCEELGLCEED